MAQTNQLRESSYQRAPPNSNARRIYDRSSACRARPSKGSISPILARQSTHCPRGVPCLKRLHFALCPTLLPNCLQPKFKMGSISDHNGLQTVDISAYLHSNDPVSRKAKADELVKAIHGHGACGIVGHNIHIETWREALERSKEFFDLPLEEKRKVDHPQGTVPHRGYTGMGRESIYSKDELEAMAGNPGARADKALDWNVRSSIVFFLLEFSNRMFGGRSITILAATRNLSTIIVGSTKKPCPDSGNS